MTDEERDIITRFIQRVSGAVPPGGPGTAAPQLPPIDREADGLIGDLFVRYPETRYRLTQTAFVQEAAVTEAQNRIKRLEWELDQTRQALATAQRQIQAQAAQPVPPPAPPAPVQRSSFFSGVFGGAQPEPARPQAPTPPANMAPAAAPNPWGQAPGYGAPPQQAYAPPQAYQQAPPGYGQAAPPPGYAQAPQAPGMFQRPGTGFLGSALTTAAGVAGGMVVGNALTDMFSGHHGGFGGGLGGTPGSVPAVNETTINNNYAAPDPNFPSPDEAGPYRPWGQGGWDQSPPGQTVADYENTDQPEEGYWSKDAVYNQDTTTPDDTTDV